MGNVPGPNPCCIHEKRKKEGVAYRCCNCDNRAFPGEASPPLPDPYPPGTRHGPLQLGWPARRK